MEVADGENPFCIEDNFWDQLEETLEIEDQPEERLENQVGGKYQ